MLALLLTVSPAPAQPPSSTSYVLGQDVFTQGGDAASSSSFLLEGSLAQPMTVGEVTSSSYLLQSGFWNGLATTYTLVITGAGSGRGTVTGPGISCTVDAGATSGDCSESATYGTNFQLVAVPDPMNQHEPWVGCDSTLTTNQADDTCVLDLLANTDLEAAFTLLGTITGRLWRDENGNGLEDPSEPSLGGVTVRLENGTGTVATTTTGMDGTYLFNDVAPGDYEVRVDSATLPAGVVPTYDPDGAGTPHVTSFNLSDGEDLGGVSFGYQPFIDLVLTKTASTASLTNDGTILYTLTVVNLGPADATDVVVTDFLPSGVTLLETSGCAEDPAGVPTCSLGDLPAAGEATYTIRVSVSIPSNALANTATVAATEVDLNPADDTATAVSDGAAIAAIPTVSEAMLALLALLLAGLGVFTLGRGGAGGT